MHTFDKSAFTNHKKRKRFLTMILSKPTVIIKIEMSYIIKTSEEKKGKEKGKKEGKEREKRERKREHNSSQPSTQLWDTCVVSSFVFPSSSRDVGCGGVGKPRHSTVAQVVE